MGAIVAISGVDCAGKSTQIALLSRALEERGSRPVQLWYRPGYSPALDAARAWVRRLRPSALPDPGDRAAHARAFGRPAVRRAWIATAVIDTLTQYGARLRALRAAGRTVICDRYLDDALLDLQLRFPEAVAPGGAIERGLRAACAKPDRSFLLWLSHGEMLRRMQLKREPFPDPPELRDRRYRAYEGLANSGRFEVVDASRSIDEVHEDILARVLEGRAPRVSGRPLR